MSAVYGICHFDGSPVLPETGAAMMREFVYHADTVGIWRNEQVFFGCHAQHITPESVRETLPYHDGISGLTITADAIIDNRGELCEKLGIRDPVDLSDSQLIMQAYRRWGSDCPAYLVGDFAFAVWDDRRQELFCAADHTGTRTFYYYRSRGTFAFSTLIRPLFALPGIERQYDETWIGDFLAMPSVMHQLDPELTLYKGIFLLPAGHSLTVRPDGVVKRVYWEATGEPKFRLESDEDYEAAFREVLSEAVSCRLRSIRPVGVMMSGGLDSTSVACVAAGELAKDGRRLLAFNAVPMLGYRDWLPAGKVADESGYVEAVREHAGNIDVVYYRSEGRHSLSDTDRFFDILEQPYKIFENLFWIDAIMLAARERNMGVVLTGSAGNSTISWGDIKSYLIYLFHKGQWLRVLGESWAVAKRKPQPLKSWYGLLMTLLPYGIQRQILQVRYPYKLKEVEDLSPVNPELTRQISLGNRFRRFGYDPLFINRLDATEARRKLLEPAVFSHMGPITTKLSLAHGMAMRDPTMDKRVIEFCLGVPASQYVRDGQNRFLLRRAMSGLLPDKVRLNTSERGKQSADWSQRLQSCWPDLAAEISSIGALEKERRFLDLARIQRELAKVDIEIGADNSSLRMLVRSLIFCRFLRRDGNIGGGGYLLSS